MPFVWNVAQARYRDVATGRFVSRSVVISLLRESMLSAGSEAKVLGAEVSAGRLSVKDFGKLFRREVQDEFTRQYIIGRGGLGSMTQSDWGRLGRMLRDQYEFAAGFEKDIPNLSLAQIQNRAEMYMKASGSAFEQGQRQSMRESGKTKERWQLGDAEHCDDCERLAGMGWVEIGTLPTVPRAGGTACLVNCECQIIYS